MTSDSIIERKVFPEGGVIFKQNDEGRCAYIIQKGEVEIVKVDENEKETQIATIPKGGIFGEMALIDQSPRMAMARALEPVTLIVVTQMMLEEKLRKTDPFVRGLLNILSATIRRQNEKL